MRFMTRRRLFWTFLCVSVRPRALGRGAQFVRVQFGETPLFRCVCYVSLCFFVVYCYNLLYRSLCGERLRLFPAALCSSCRVWKICGCGKQAQFSCVFILFCQSALNLLYIWWPRVCWQWGRPLGCQFLFVPLLFATISLEPSFAIFTYLFENTIAAKKNSLPWSYLPPGLEVKITICVKESDVFRLKSFFLHDFIAFSPICPLHCERKK